MPADLALPGLPQRDLLLREFRSWASWVDLEPGLIVFQINGAMRDDGISQLGCGITARGAATAESRYVFGNAATAETSLRFSGLEATFDPSTIRVLTGVGVTGGWACWEIGAGGGSIARLDQLEVARHDVTADVIPSARYDLIHARLVLSHLPQVIR